MKRITSPRPPMVISYLRFSRTEQLKGDSTRRQLDLSERYALERGWQIDQSISDKGVSAFRGANATSGSLSKLLDMVKAKRIPRGAVLLVESLDRLSRTEIAEALELFMGLIRAGIRIVTLGDGFEYSAEHLDLSNLMYSLMVMSRAHEESATKSKRLSEAWKAKRSRIATEPLTRLMPAWLKFEDNKIVVIEEKAAAVRRIFDMVLKGHGITTIVKTLNQDRETIGSLRDYLQRSYVNKILHSRAVLGEFQPHKLVYRDGKKTREPVGPPIVGYFPTIVAEQDFYAAQATLRARQTHTGPNTKYLNLFKGLLFDADDKSPLQMQHKSSRAYASAAAINGQPGHSPYIAFPVPAFEAAFLWRISETHTLDLDDTQADDLNRKVAAVSGRIQSVAKRISDINATLSDADETADLSALIPALTKLDGEKNRLTEDYELLQQQLKTAKMGSPAEAVDQIAALVTGSATGFASDAARLQLQLAIRHLVTRIDCHMSREGVITRCAVAATLRNKSQVWYIAAVHSRVPTEVLITSDASDEKTYIIAGEDNEKQSSKAQRGISLRTVDRVSQLWKDSIRPVSIAEECGISVSQVYRIAGALPRLKKWEPANRWDRRPRKARGAIKPQPANAK
jgi:DNA invertase Pin-like site-specific DNA recombinase